MMRCLLCFITILSLLWGCIDIQEKVVHKSSVVRERIIIADRLIYKKGLYITLEIMGEYKKEIKVQGIIKTKDRLIDKNIGYTKGSNIANLFFELPYDLDKNEIILVANAYRKNQQLIGKINKRLFIDKIGKTTKTIKKKGNTSLKRSSILHEKKLEPNNFTPAVSDKNRGYTIFSRSDLDLVFENDRPSANEICKDISINVVRNEYQNVTFSILPLSSIGKTQIKFHWEDSDDLIAKEGRVELGYINNVQSKVGMPEGTHRNLPWLLVPQDNFISYEGKCQRVYIQFYIPPLTPIGSKKGYITIIPENGKNTRLPITINVYPITLSHIPNKHYFMLMTYEFTELTNKWSEEKKAYILNQGKKVLEDYKAHGMTTICPHSPFFAIFDSKGDIDLSDIKGAMNAVKQVGFEGPVFWYFGHLLQTAKPKHPGNILGFNKDIHIKRAKQIVRIMGKEIEKNDWHEIIYMPIDEPDDKYQDINNKRFTSAQLLLNAINEEGGKTSTTAMKYEALDHVDYFITSQLNREDLKLAKKEGKTYIVYNNIVTTGCDNPLYARFIYGYYTWKNELDGMCSWTFQNTQNATGDPKKCDTEGRDIFLAYPNSIGPESTIKWEAVREGIEDHKLIYQLEKRIESLKQRGKDSEVYEKYIWDLKRRDISPEPLYRNKSDRELQNILSNLKESTAQLILSADAELK